MRLLLVVVAAGLSSMPATSYATSRAASAGCSALTTQIAAYSERFELTGSIDREVMVLHLRHALTRDPVRAASIEAMVTQVDGGSRPALMLRADPMKPAGAYAIRGAFLATPGLYRIAFSIAAAAQRDVLVGMLSVPEPCVSTSSHRRKQLAVLGMAAVVLTGLVVVVLQWSRRFG